MKTKLTKQFWITLVIFSLIGQVAWVVENMYFNVFIYKMFHASAKDISTMVAASAIVATLTTLFVGAFSDKVGKRKVFICVGYILWGITILSFALIRVDTLQRVIPDTMSVLSAGVTLVIIMDCLMTFFGSSANDACFNAWLTDKTDKTNRGSVEGINAMMPLVAILAVFGGFMFFDLEKPRSWSIIFLLIGMIVIGMGLLGIFLIKEKKLDTENNQQYFYNIFYGFRPSVMKANPILYMTLAAFAVFGISIQTFMPYLILYYEKSLGMSNYVLIMAPAIIIAAIITAFYGRVYDKYRFEKAIIPTIIVLMVGYLLLYFFQQTAVVFVGSLFMMTGYLTGMAVFGAMIRDYTLEDKNGLFQGLRIIGQVLIPGVIGPVIGATVLTNARKITNSDGTQSFIPNGNIFIAAFVGAIFIWFLLAFIFKLRKTKHNHLMTEDGENLSQLPWQEYPRPQLKRDSYLNLNGTWEFAFTHSKQIPEKFKKQILVPFPPESMLSGVEEIQGQQEYLYYRKVITLPMGFTKDKVLLHFGAVDQIATVYINGEEAGTHVGGYLPFSVDITKYLKEENTIVLRVKDHLNHELPYGKQRKKRGGMWYTPVSGIWQTVWMESVSVDYIQKLEITPALDAITIKVVSLARNKTITIRTEEGNIVHNFEGDRITISIDNPRHWTPEDPYIYEFEIRTTHDVVQSYFALRTITIKEVDKIARLCLNNKPYFFHGLLDQGYFSDGIYLPASGNGYYKDIITMKELGFNTLRKHIKVEPLWFYYLCDKLGMVVFQDMVNNGHYSYVKDTILPTLGFTKRNDTQMVREKDVKGNFEKFTQETIQHLYNVPSICCWTIFNEGWGQFDSDRIYEQVKEQDKTRFIDSTSGWFEQKKSDVRSMHVYFKPIKVTHDERPIVISEFGGYAYKLDKHSFNLNKTYGYRIFDEQLNFQNAIYKLYTQEIVPQIKDGISASIYTQLSDVEDETNGLFTYDRRVLKVDKKEMLKIAKSLCQ
ncbi:MAG: MFS transporter [Lachnospiraceae bacterium]|nr:MFS transporter [Lachnospiraceae bacterium]